MAAKALVVITVLLAAATYAEHEIGDPDAPVTIVEYASMTCDYCIRFHREVFPLLKSRHIDTGRVRFVYRDFPTSATAARGAVAARCAGDRYFAMLDALYASVGDWTRAADVDTAFTNLGVELGLDKEPFRVCLRDPKHAYAIANEQRSARENGVLGTPTFTINGTMESGIKTIGEIEALIEESLE